MIENVRSVYVDCTESIMSRLNTGIQRNVKSIILRSEYISKEFGVNVIPVISLGGKLFKYNTSKKNSTCISLLSNTFAYLRNSLDRLFGKKLEIVRNETSADHPDVSNFSHQKILAFCRMAMPYFFLMAYRFDGFVRELRSIKTNENDIILFADSFVNADTYRSLLSYDNVCKIVVVHDVIPITAPEFFDDILAYMFDKHFKQVIHHVHGIVTISDSERKSIRAFLDTLPKRSDIPVEYYHLGADFVPLQQDGSRVRDIVKSALSSNNVFLMVGTIEPRKNHTYVLDAFEELWRRGVNVSLCIIGKIGWKCSDLLVRIKTHDLLGKSLFCFHDVSDEELAFCYERCGAVIFASIAEGFGLPLVEAMSYGRSVLVSDIPVFREIGADYPIYFPLNELDALVQCLYNFNLGEFKKTEPKSWISWDESVLNLFGKVLLIADDCKQRGEVK